MNSIFRIKSEEKKKECKGLFYSGRATIYTTTQGVERRDTLRLLKRKSCTGCNKCMFLLEYLNEEVAEQSINFVFPEKIKHDGIYKLTSTMIHGGYNYEGVNEGAEYELAFVPINEDGLE